MHLSLKTISFVFAWIDGFVLLFDAKIDYILRMHGFMRNILHTCLLEMISKGIMKPAHIRKIFLNG